VGTARLPQRCRALAIKVRTPVWMVAYAVVLALLGATYATLVFSGPKVALVFALAALATVLVAVVLTLKR
jgi:hypothetical protein